jgi:hypothetical protein
MSEREFPNLLIGGITQTNLGDVLRGVSFLRQATVQAPVEAVHR